MSSVRMVRFNSITLKADPDSERNNNKQNDPSFSEADFGIFYAVCFVISIITFAADILLHCWLAYVFYMRKEMLYFVLTITFIIVPSIVSTGFSMRWSVEICSSLIFENCIEFILSILFLGIFWTKTMKPHHLNHL